MSRTATRRSKAVASDGDTRLDRAAGTMAEMLEVRGFTAVKAEKGQPDIDDGAAIESFYWYTAERPKHYTDALLYYFDPTTDTSASDYSAVAADVDEEQKQRGNAGRTIFIAILPNKEQSHIVKRAAEHNTYMDSDGKDADSPYYKVELWSYDELQYSVAANACVPAHGFASQEEIKWLRSIEPNPAKLPKIRSDDPMARYIGALAGDIVKIGEHTSTGIQSKFRVCI